MHALNLLKLALRKAEDLPGLTARIDAAVVAEGKDLFESVKACLEHLEPYGWTIQSIYDYQLAVTPADMEMHGLLDLYQRGRANGVAWVAEGNETLSDSMRP